nr:MAG TPA: tail fiber assembly protein [Caudoviricetes sp.]
MTMYFKNGFFDDTDGGFVPEGAVEISQDKYIELINGQSQGKQIIADKTGKPVLIDPQPSAAHVLNIDTLKWEISVEKQTALFTQQKENLLNKLADKADQLKNSLLVGYPQTEIESFYRQEKEALAWQSNHNTPTPMLEQIARVRGIPFELLVEKVIEKASQFAVAIGIIIGQRQAFEDRLLALKTMEELTALEKEIEEWKFQAN